MVRSNWEKHPNGNHVRIPHNQDQKGGLLNLGIPDEILSVKIKQFYFINTTKIIEMCF